MGHMLTGHVFTGHVFTALAAVRTRFTDFGAEPLASTPDELGRFISSEVAKWRAIIGKAGITLDP